MTVRQILAQVIAGIPNLLHQDATARFIRDPATHVHVHTPDEVADKIASILPALLAAEGCVILELPHIAPDGHGGWSVRVPLSEQPWADGEIFINQAGGITLAGIPAKLPLSDVPAVGSALLAVHTAASNRRYQAGRGGTPRPRR
ncbi:hypothetical protein [Mycobacteroides abscessus]|uniref:hypothetical protein n=1 Tax=Mycobacteroides abscessus TaxID=36809 RepID=UPI00092A3BEC|nr:hypothetical protein [Mycobacteroides abscessus]SHQ49166.1 Uncharacterised protein [Mycobacteroides abscessus subsp. abscessus]SKQ84721.1 Uncharacterised protein [Mycobacteroides abscessus subsp. massiliense]SLC49370.1 Uncharacterised protein [Mycobacteroides abscessus subsp. massiliense]